MEFAYGDVTLWISPMLPALAIVAAAVVRIVRAVVSADLGSEGV